MQAAFLVIDGAVSKPGERAWISEMYGFSFACAKADVWHRAHHSAMLYPGYYTDGMLKYMV
jgi:hypothetical protein